MSEKGLEPDIRSRRGNVAEVPKAGIRCADLAAAFDSSIMAAQRCISGGGQPPADLGFGGCGGHDLASSLLGSELMPSCRSAWPYYWSSLVCATARLASGMAEKF